MIPLLVGFFWRLPDIQISQWTQECTDYDVGLFLTNMVFLAAGYESLGALGGELNFSANKLMIAYSLSIGISCLMICIPVIASATIPYSDCTSWYDGYYAVAYGEIWTPLYYSVLLSALICMMAFTVLMFIIGSRLIWAMAQKHLLLLPDGTLLLEAEMTLMPKGDGVGDNEWDHNEDAADINDVEITRIPLGILPERMGAIWERTGSPVAGVILFGITTAILCSFMTYATTMVIIFFSFVSTYLFVIASFIMMRYYEADTPRWYKVPGGNIGAWTVSVLCIGLMVLFCVWALVSQTYIQYAAAIYGGVNLLIILYYFTVKQWLQRKREEEERAFIQEQYPPLIDSGDVHGSAGAAKDEMAEAVAI